MSVCTDTLILRDLLQDIGLCSCGANESEIHRAGRSRHPSPLVSFFLLREACFLLKAFS